MKPIHWPGLCGFTCECKLVTSLWNVIVFHDEDFVSSTHCGTGTQLSVLKPRATFPATFNLQTWLLFLYIVQSRCVRSCLFVSLWDFLGDVDNDEDWQHYSDAGIRRQHTRLELINQLDVIYRAKMTKSTFLPASVS